MKAAPFFSRRFVFRGEPSQARVPRVTFLYAAASIRSRPCAFGAQPCAIGNNRSNRRLFSMKAMFLAGRLVFGGFFIYNGVNHFLKWKTLAKYAGSKHVPDPERAVIVSGALLLLGGSLISLGVKPKLGAAAIMMFLGAVSPTMHDFWAQHDPGRQMQETVNFTKNMALLGSALALMALREPWPLSIPVGRPHGMARFLQMARQAMAA
jgi:putative oxidoreductase